MLKKLFVFAGWLLLLCLVFLFCCITGLWHEWSTVTIFAVWVSVLIAAVLLWVSLLWLTQLIKDNKARCFFRKFRLSRREFVLFEHWKSGAAVVRRIQRKRPPIPWYLLLGDRCGKTSLLAGSGLPVFSGNKQDNNVVPTHTLRWWFFHNAGFLDISGNFLNGAPVFHRAWGKMVGWITRAPAPAGILICLSVSELMNEDISALHEKARKIRTRIDPLTRKLKRRLPLYITVTQCDKFPAFSLWARQLSFAQQQQALGYYWPTPPEIDGKDTSMLLPLFTALKKGFDLARLSIVSTPDSVQDKVALLAFPEAFARLEDPLRLFVGSLCEPNAYFTPATLGGVWFTASEQQDKNKSHRTTLFVHDLLAYHLPAFSKTRDVQWHYRRKLRAVTGRLLLLGCVMALGYSALKSTLLMQHNMATLPPGALVDALMKNETHHDSPLVYLPFAHVLNDQHRLAEARLRKTLPSQLLNVDAQLPAYEQQFLTASLPVKRQMVLSLAQTLLTRQAMRDGATLAALSLRPAIPDALRLYSVDPSASPYARLALERREMQQPTGARHLAALHRLLTALINDDHTLAWLTAPDDTLHDVLASDYWPQLPDTVRLSGIWTRQGEVQLTEWVNLIVQAGGKSPSGAALQQFMQALPVLRQNAWRRMLFSVASYLQDQAPRSLSQNQLIDMAQGQSPAMQFARRVALDLEDIPKQSLQPWLAELQRLQRLPAQAAENPALKTLKGVDATFRQGLRAWLGGGQSLSAATSGSPVIIAWQKWQAALNTVISQALNQGALSPALTDGLFAAQTDAQKNNPLVTLFAGFEQLRKTSDPRSQEIGVDAVWSLYQSEAGALLAHSLSRSGCWLNEQWQSNVLWPIRKNTQRLEYDAQVVLTGQYLADFFRGPAKNLLIINEQGPQAGSYQGQTLPLSDEFLNIARHLLNPEDVLDVPQRPFTENADQLAVLNDQMAQLTLQQKAMESTPYSISIVSQPATVPEGARLIPTGSRLTLECQSGVSVLDSMNFAEQTQFIWRPGQCKRVTLEVKFPDFTSAYHYNGNSAWPDFLNDFVRGEALIDVRDFDDNADAMAALNIRQILLRFRISDPTQLRNAWMGWKALDSQLADLKKQKQRLETTKQTLEPSAALRGRLSGLPETVSECR